MDRENTEKCECLHRQQFSVSEASPPATVNDRANDRSQSHFHNPEAEKNAIDIPRNISRESYGMTQRKCVLIYFYS